MPRQKLRLVESRESDSFDDQKSAAQIASSETLSTNHQEFLEYLLSQIKRLQHGDDAGNWFDDPVTTFSEDVSLQSLLELIQATQSRFQEVECTATDAVNDFVYIRADKVGDKWRVEQADPDDETKMPAVGVLVSKAGTDGIIQIVGPCTLFSGLDYTKPAYHLTSSGIQVAPPTPGGSGYAMVQNLGKPVASDVLLLTNDTRMIKRRA